MGVIFIQLVAHLFYPLNILLFLTCGLLCLLVLWGWQLLKRLSQLVCNLCQGLRGKAYRLVIGSLVLCDGVVNLREQDLYLLHQLRTVPLHCLAPYEGVLVGFRLYLGAVYILHVQRHKTFCAEKQHKLGEDVVYLGLHAVAETVDGDEVRLLIARQPDEVNVALQGFLYLAAGIDVVHVGIDDNLQEHLRVIRTATAFLVQLAESRKVEALHNDA